MVSHENIVNEFANGGEQSVADSLRGMQSRWSAWAPPRPPRSILNGQWGLIDLLAVRAPAWMTTMLLDHQRHVVDVDLLDHPGHDRGHGFQVMPAPGAKIKAMVERIAVDQFRREGGAFVLWVTGLPADAAPLLALRRCRFGRLDDVGGRRLGRGRGILPRRGELLLETSNGALEHLQTRLLGVQLRLQAPTVRARLPCLGSHDGLCYTHRREYTTPVNGHVVGRAAHESLGVIVVDQGLILITTDSAILFPAEAVWADQFSQVGANSVDPEFSD